MQRSVAYIEADKMIIPCIQFAYNLSISSRPTILQQQKTHLNKWGRKKIIRI